MITNISVSKNIVLLFSFFILLLTSNVYAQTTGGVDPNDLSGVRIDELSDEQVMAIVKQGEAAGLTIDQAQSMAVKRGLPASEVQKLKDRIAKIQSGNVKNNEGTKNTGLIENKPPHMLIEKPRENDTLVGKEQNANNQGVKSTIYGQEYFRNGDIRIFDKSTDAKAPSNYLIGIGDELGISVFGYSYYNEVLKVDERGAINPSQMGPIFIKGLTYDRAKLLIRSKMNQYFDLSNNKLEITLAYSRSITVNIVGNVMKPGSYKIPAVNTAFNALILAGGPSDIGSLREIQIRRNGKTIRILDLYEFLNNPNSKQDYFLEDNDFIVVLTSKKVVSIEGEVKRPGKFELLVSENLNQILVYSGGLNSDALKEVIQIKRRTDKEVLILDINLDSLLKNRKDYPLFDGDIIVIRKSISEFVNVASIRGGLNYPGLYRFYNGMRISDLIERAGGVRSKEDIGNAYLIRLKEDQTKELINVNIIDILSNPSSPNNLELKKSDELTILSKSNLINGYTVSVNGAVKNPRIITYTEGMTLADVIRQTNGFAPDAENLRIEISRLNYFSENYVDGQDNKIVIEKIQLSDSQDNLSEQEARILLRPFDEIFVRSVPNFNSQYLVELRGEVKYPGKYALLSKDEKVSSVIKRAGGLNKYAFPEAATFYRPELPGGYIVLKLNDILNSRNSKYNFTLRQGDIITIPTVTDYVGIRGSSIEYLSVVDKDQVNAPYVFGRRANYYIKEYGNGFTKESWRKKTYVLQPNAKINRTRNFVLFKIYPKVSKGSVIFVVNKPKKEKQILKEAEPFNWNKFIESTTVKITGLLTLLLIFKQL